MTDRIATAWAAYLEREGPFTGSALHEPEAVVAAKRAFYAGADATWLLQREIVRAGTGWADMDMELAIFARDVAEGKA